MINMMILIFLALFIFFICYINLYKIGSNYQNVQQIESGIRTSFGVRINNKYDRVSNIKLYIVFCDF